MTHSVQGANSLIRTAALVIAGVYAYRRFTEGTAEELKASTRIAPLGQFVVAWGVVFLGLSLIAPASPTLAGNMALLVMLASLLANGVQVSRDLRAGLTRGQRERELLAGKVPRGSHLHPFGTAVTPNRAGAAGESEPPERRTV